MKSTPQKTAVISCAMLLGLGLATGTRADNPEATEQQNPGNMQTDQSQHGTTIKGEVVRIDGDMWFIKDVRGKEIGLHVDQSTRQSEEAVDKNKIKGVVVEAVVDDQYHALSISSLDRRNDHADDATEENK